MANPRIEPFFHAGSSTYSYVVADPESARCAVLDPVLDYDIGAARTGHRAADAIAGFVDAQGLACEWILETHPHADHITAAPYLKERLGGTIAIGAGVREVIEIFRPILGFGPEVGADGSDFDHLIADGERLSIGALELEAASAPGHTRACMVYRVADALFAGDVIFMPDFGSGRTDFPGGSAATLYDSVRRIYALPDATRIFVGHDYAPGGRAHACETTVGAEKAGNVHLRAETAKDEFVRLREGRDATLGAPPMLLTAVQVNLRAGRFPPPEANGLAYLRIPVDAL